MRHFRAFKTKSILYLLRFILRDRFPCGYLAEKVWITWVFTYRLCKFFNGLVQKNTRACANFAHNKRNYTKEIITKGLIKINPPEYYIPNGFLRNGVYKLHSPVNAIIKVLEKYVNRNFYKKTGV